MSGDSPGGIVRVCRPRPCCDLGPLTGPRIFFKGTTNTDRDSPSEETFSAGGVSLALTFGTLLSSQGTDASFGAESTAPSGRLTFGLCCFVFLLFRFRVSSLAHRFGRFAFLAFGVRRAPALSAFQTLADLPTRFSSVCFPPRNSRSFGFRPFEPSRSSDPLRSLLRLRKFVLPAAFRDPRTLADRISHRLIGGNSRSGNLRGHPITELRV